MRLLLDYFGDAPSAWQAPVSDLRASGLPGKIAENLLSTRSSISIQKLWERVNTLGISVLTWEDAEYPSHLLEIDQPPPLLYLKGSLTDADDWAVAIVGTRRVTSYGRQVTEEPATVLAQNGVTVVSGLARGVDAIAHQACLQAGGRTLAVLGSGVDRIYPPENRRLAEQIITAGAVMSDYPPGTAPDAINFPPRNRIISGLSRAVIVIEAGETSGALITATFAADQGREVFAVPGMIYAPQSKGTNRLISQGARPLLSPDDVLEFLNVDQMKEYRTARTVLPADATEAQLYAVIGQEPLHVDEIRLRTNLPIEQVSAALTLMELKGLVRQVGGMQYVAVHEQPASYKTGEE